MFPWSDPSQPLRFDHFMRAALHDRARGYYARRIRTVGRGGDFTTTPTLAPALARAIAAWVIARKCPNLIELGPGEGTLAASILGNLSRFRRPRLHLVETSAPLLELQKSKLPKSVRWHTSIHDALAACKGRACIYSNEFVDAFPVRRFRHEAGIWHELHLLPDRSLWLPTNSLPPSALLECPGPPGSVVEVHDSYREWIRNQLVPNWHDGSMLTIDYARLPDRTPVSGTLRAYFHHQRLTGDECYQRPGHQDLTADVHFADLQAWSLPEIKTVRITNQSEFLAPHVDPSAPGDRFAVDPHGAGCAFQVLDQHLADIEI